MSFLPESFAVPEVLATPYFKLRPIRVADAEMDHEAVMESQAALWALFGKHWGWPSADLTLERNRGDLAWHEDEFRARRSFDYAVMTPGENALLGCVYVDPPTKAGFDAEVFYWVRDSAREAGLETVLSETVRDWIRTWPFSRVAFPGRDNAWDEWDALPARA